MLTPKQIQDLAEPIESIYISMTNELLVNIGKHITSPTWTHTAAWEIQKLSEMGQLTAENAAIINRWIRQIPQAMRDTMEETRREALGDIEKAMNRAAEQGYVTPPLADSTVQLFQDYAEQATDRMNMVNTTMLQSSLDKYREAIDLTEEIMREAEGTQRILNEETGAVIQGTETRTQALNRAITRIAKEGLAGFYDRAGRAWTPEAYVNMDIRTTVHNAAIQSVRTRMQDYNTQVFQISSHAGARPLCYPYQGKFYSWDNTSGTILLGDGSSVRYEPLNSTSYGQPAGIFGINCGHYPIPIIPGYTIPHGADDIQPKELNDKIYQESQQQRALERKIRDAKRVVEMGNTSPEAKQKVKDAQAQMREFIAQTGRTRRYDREKIYGGREQQRKKPEVQVEKGEAYVPLKTIPKAEAYANKFSGTVEYKGLSVDNANTVNRQLERLTARYPIKPLEVIEGRSIAAVAEANYRKLYINGKKLGKTLSEENKAFQNEQNSVKSSIQILTDRFKDKAKLPPSVQADIERKENFLKFKRRGVHSSYKDHVACVITHEYGHILSDQYFGMINRERANPNYATDWRLRDMNSRWEEAYKKALSTGDIYNLSEYGSKNVREFFAESFLAQEMGEKLPDYVEMLMKEVLSNGIM